MTRKNNSMAGAEILSLEDFVGDSDVPRYPALAEAEASELAERPGGRFTFSSSRRRVGRAGKLEREALDLRAKALELLK